MPGVSLMYCIICGLGLIFTYVVLPETEDRSLEDIELHFSDNTKNLTDRKIAKSKTRNSSIYAKDAKTNDIYSENGNGIKNLNLGRDNKAFEIECSKVWFLKKWNVLFVNFIDWARIVIRSILFLPLIV